VPVLVHYVGDVQSPGPLLASGRDADIFEYGPGLVLRRSRRGRSMAGEARTMEYLRSHGYPVPAVEELSDDGTDLVMERIDGSSMVDYMTRHPWAIRRQGALLATLHNRLHAIAPPEFLRPSPVGAGECFLHLDLHPLNVMIGPKGPVVIDWPNAARGDPLVDVALAWVLMAAGEIPSNPMIAAVLGRARAVLINGFLSMVDLDRDLLKHKLREVVDFKVRDPNMSESEQRAMWRVVEKFEVPG
jgi:aminoglycoside phosphotransferase (APT) family kinase protein